METRIVSNNDSEEQKDVDEKEKPIEPPSDIDRVSKLRNIIQHEIVEKKHTEGNRNFYDLDGDNNVTELRIQYAVVDNPNLFFSQISELKNLKRLTIENVVLKSINSISNCNSITHLAIVNASTEEIEGISKLTKLTSLSLRNNNINKANRMDKSKLLSTLVKLEFLDLSGNNIKSIELLKSSGNLTSINLSNNNLTNADFLKECNNLEIVDLSNNNIERIELKNLKKLREVTLDDNRISVLAITKCNKIKQLSARNNKIKKIDCISELAELEILDLTNNQLKALPSTRMLRKLYSLQLAANEIQDVSTLFALPNLNKEAFLEFGIKDNPISNPPPEIIQRGINALNSWLFGEKEFVNEVKVTLVGHGEVGKTTLVKLIEGKDIDYNEPTTHRIKITNYNVDHDKKKIKINFWDFGGQDILHSTHQFFMSKRSIYLLILDGRKDENPDYWLQLIESFAGSSPVLLVMNKIDSNPRYDVDRRFLKKKYPFILGFYRTSCASKIGIDELRAGILSALDSVEILTTEWRRDWLNVKERIESMRMSYINEKEYGNICEEEGVYVENDREALADFLNDLGSIVHFKDLRLNNLHILQPDWASRAAYKIINNERVVMNQGIFELPWMSEIMRKEDTADFEYQKNVYPYILDLMQKFELCYPLVEAYKYLVPELMDIQQPELPDFGEQRVLEFYFKYEDFFPPSIMPKFIVRMHDDVKGNLRWRTGIVLQPSIFDSLAVIIADQNEKTIRISIVGTNSREYLFFIRRTFHSLHNRFEKLKVSEWIPVPGHPNIAIEYSELVGFESVGQETFYFPKIKESIQVNHVLNFVEPPSIRKSSFKWDTFICHSSKDYRKIQNIVDEFKGKSISYWIDEEQIQPGSSVIDKITEGILNSKYIIVCLSQNQIHSGWCRKEYQSILNRIINGTAKQKILPLILDNLSEDEIPLFIGDLRCERYLVY